MKLQEYIDMLNQYSDADKQREVELPTDSVKFIPVRETVTVSIELELDVFLHKVTSEQIKKSVQRALRVGLDSHSHYICPPNCLTFSELNVVFPLELNSK